MRWVISGSRDLYDVTLVWSLLDRHIQSGDYLFFGDARGVDEITHWYCHYYAIAHDPPYVPEWETYGNKAGPIRNAVMVTKAEQGVCIGETRGTMSTVRCLRHDHKPYIHYSATGTLLLN